MGTCRVARRRPARRPPSWSCVAGPALAAAWTARCSLRCSRRARRGGWRTAARRASDRVGAGDELTRPGRSARRPPLARCCCCSARAAAAWAARADLAAGLAARGSTRHGRAARGTTEATLGFTGVGAGLAPVEIARPAPPPSRTCGRCGRSRRLARDVDVVHAHGLRAGGLAVLGAAALAAACRWPSRCTTRCCRGRPRRSGAAAYAVLERLVARGADVVLGVSGDLEDAAAPLGARRRPARRGSRAAGAGPRARDPGAGARRARRPGRPARSSSCVRGWPSRRGCHCSLDAAALAAAAADGPAVVGAVAGDGPLRAGCSAGSTTRAAACGCSAGATTCPTCSPPPTSSCRPRSGRGSRIGRPGGAARRRRDRRHGRRRHPGGGRGTPQCSCRPATPTALARERLARRCSTTPARAGAAAARAARDRARRARRTPTTRAPPAARRCYRDMLRADGRLLEH